MKRKIVKQGKNALTISLPAEWTKKFNLKAGDEVDATEEEGFLKINAKASGERTVEIDIKELNEALVWTYIISAYRKGYDELKIKFKKEQIELIQKIVNALLGLAIIEQTQDSCIVRDLSEHPSEKEFKNIMRRIFYLIEEIGDSALKALKEKNKDTLRNIEYQDYNINKFANFCLRLISKKSLSSSSDFVVSELENVGDEYTRLALDLSTEKIFKISKEVLEIFEETNKLFIVFHEFYYNFSNQRATDIVNRKNKLNKMINSVSKSREETIVIFHLSKIIHLIANLGERVIMVNLA